MTKTNACTLQASREQLAVSEFANALLVIPKTLASNAAKDATQLVAKLRAFHNRSQQDKNLEHLKWYALFWEKSALKFIVNRQELANYFVSAI